MESKRRKEEDELEIVSTLVETIEKAKKTEISYILEEEIFDYLEEWINNMLDKTPEQEKYLLRNLYADAAVLFKKEKAVKIEIKSYEHLDYFEKALPNGADLIYSGKLRNLYATTPGIKNFLKLFYLLGGLMYKSNHFSLIPELIKCAQDFILLIPNDIRYLIPKFLAVIKDQESRLVIIDDGIGSINNPWKSAAPLFLGQTGVAFDFGPKPSQEEVKNNIQNNLTFNQSRG